MSFIYNTIIYQPIVNTLVFIYQTVALEDLGLAIIILAIVIRLVLYPLFHKTTKTQAVMQAIQPKIEKIRSDHKDNKEKEAQALLALYREHQINPFTGFLLILLQLPIMFALYHLFVPDISTEKLIGLYSFIKAPSALNDVFLGLLNLNKPNIILAGLTAIAQYFQGRLGLASQNKAGGQASATERMAGNMVFIGPVITLVVFAKLPAAVVLFWLVTTVFSIGQQILVNKEIANGKPGTIH